MRSPSGFINGVKPDLENNKRKQVVSIIGAIEPPNTDALLREAKLMIGEALIACRGISDPVNLAKSISHIIQALAKIINIDKLEKIDLSSLSDTELKNITEKLLKEI